LLFLSTADGGLKQPLSGSNAATLETADKAAQQQSTVTSTEPPSIFIPLFAGGHVVGVLVVFVQGQEDLNRQNRELITRLAEQITFGIERLTSIETAEKARMQVEGMKIRNALLSSVSHDLRTPLASIMGAASSIMADGAETMREENRELVQSIYRESDRLNNFLRNLLDMTRIESGAVRLKKEWNSLEESVGVALGRLKKNLEPFKITTEVPDNLQLVLYDEQLIDQVLTNLIENAAKYAPSATEIKIWVKPEEKAVIFGVSNTGCKLPPGAEAQIFEKFYRGESSAGTVYGAGLGLTICRGIMQAHAGQIYAERFGDDGISICCCLPAEGKPPEIQVEEMEEV
ncbi:MAG: sensor histidine kinase, partial [Terriglobales bacterium]